MRPIIGRRQTMGLAVGMLAGAALPARAIPIADVPAPRLDPEPGARLRVLRPAKYRCASR